LILLIAAYFMHPGRLPMTSAQPAWQALMESIRSL